MCACNRVEPEEGDIETVNVRWYNAHAERIGAAD
jgi:hypothetical protein